jgi:glycine hydroxymethyltransferase
MQPDFIDYQKQVIKNAKLMTKLFKDLGYNIISGGTDCHLFLVDLTNQNITGADAEVALGQANITLNKNSVPNDTKPPIVTSGLRIGTPAITTRGFGEDEIMTVVRMIDSVLKNLDDKETTASIKAEVKTLCQRFPVYIS